MNVIGKGRSNVKSLISSIPTEITKIGINHDYDVFVANNFRIRIHDG